MAILVDTTAAASSSSPPMPSAPLGASRSPGVSPRRRFALRPIDTNPRRHAVQRRPASATPRRPTPKSKVSPTSRFFGRSSDDLVPDLERTSSSTGPKISPRSRATSVESREDDEVDEIIEWLRPAIEEVGDYPVGRACVRARALAAHLSRTRVARCAAPPQITNLVLEDTWNRFKKSPAYDKFSEMYNASLQTLDLDALAEDRRSFNVVQIMHRSGKRAKRPVQFAVRSCNR